MLFTLGLLLLLTPFPSFQSTANERKNSTGSNVTKPDAIFTLSKPKTTAALPKQTIQPTLKPNTVNQTVFPTPATTKSKSSSTIIQTTPSASTKSTIASGTLTNKDKHTAVNPVVPNKSHSASDVKSTKDKSAPTAAPNVQSVSTKSASAGSAKTTKDKLPPVVNQTISVKNPLTSDGKTPKDKPAPSVVQNVPSPPPKTATSSPKTTKTKPSASVNQTVVAKSPSTSDVKHPKEKPAIAAVQTVPTLPKDAAAGSSAASKDKGTSSANRTAVSQAPTTTKEKLTPIQPIKVVISDGCDSSNNKEQELKLAPGAPLVMTHKISLLPSACSGGCDSEMTALKERVARLEQEMSSLKEKCMLRSYSRLFYLIQVYLVFFLLLLLHRSMFLKLPT